VSAIRLEGITRTFGTGHAAARDVNLSIADGEFLVLVGPSGCGKSTLLRLIAGLEAPDLGRILIGERDVTALSPQERDLAMVFQSYALYPHMTVRENLAYGLKVRRTNRETIDTRVTAAAEALGLDGLLDRRPAQLSGGQRQRVALGRAIVRRPQAFLLDEPLSNLDPGLRVQARTEIRRLHRSLQATVVYVTHDQEEAMTLGDRIAVMREGRLEQVSSPEDIYARPVNTFVARFIGSPAMNLLPAAAVDLDAAPETTIGIRPHDVVIGDGGRPMATVELVEPRGHDALVHLRLDNGPAIVAAVSAAPPLAGSQVTVQFPLDRVHRFSPSGERVDDL
jgi:ABC-type sugar transport system ATPase subunit